MHEVIYLSPLVRLFVCLSNTWRTT